MSNDTKKMVSMEDIQAVFDSLQPPEAMSEARAESFKATARYIIGHVNKGLSQIPSELLCVEEGPALDRVEV